MSIPVLAKRWLLLVHEPPVALECRCEYCNAVARVSNALDGRVEVEYIVDGDRPPGLKLETDNNGIVAYIIKYLLLYILTACPVLLFMLFWMQRSNCLPSHPRFANKYRCHVNGLCHVWSYACFGWLNETIIFTAIGDRNAVFGHDPLTLIGWAGADRDTLIQAYVEKFESYEHRSRQATCIHNYNFTAIRCSTLLQGTRDRLEEY